MGGWHNVEQKWTDAQRKHAGAISPYLKVGSRREDVTPDGFKVEVDEIPYEVIRWKRNTGGVTFVIRYGKSEILFIFVPLPKKPTSETVLPPKVAE